MPLPRGKGKNPKGNNNPISQAVRSLVTKAVSLTCLQQANKGSAGVDGTIAWASHDSHGLNFSNRPVRTRMPGGVAGARLTPPPMPISYRFRACISHKRLLLRLARQAG